MAKIVFAGLASDSLVRSALQVLDTMEDVEIRLLEENEPVPFGSCVIFSSDGRFPSSFIREITAANERNHGVTVPDFAESAARLFALNIAKKALILGLDKNFVHALEQLYSRLHPKVKKNSVTHVRTRNEWTTGHHTKPKENKRMAFANE